MTYIPEDLAKRALETCGECQYLADCIDKAHNDHLNDCEHFELCITCVKAADKYYSEMLYSELTKHIKENKL